MALIETNDSIKEYYEEVKHLYPNISYEQFVEICKTPFRFFKIKIETDEMPTIFIKYFGKFKVHAATIKTLLKKLETKKHFNHINDERYERFKLNLQNRLKLIQENDIARRIKKDSKKRESTN